MRQAKNRNMNSSEVRSTFLRYFEEKEHRIVSSSPLIPYHDPTLLFCNAGMNQFKDTFLGRETRPYRRATTSQKCMRVSGKHNDFEDVGRSYRHHTFFEMLGNFSFGDYFKAEAIRFAWELITERFSLPKQRLYVTIFEEDEEAFALWGQETDIPKERIYRFGEKDNFWAMGETGPCGPCSEIHYDYGHSPLGHTDCDLSCSCGRYVELWNLVFMQFNRDETGRMTPLPSPSIDTGMGLERITTVLQGKVSNYDTDLFMPLIEYVCRLTSREYKKDETQDISMRILADHARAAAFLVADGQFPGNDKRGYVLRKIIRRAIVHGRKLGLQDPFLFGLAGEVGRLMGGAYPELQSHQEAISQSIRGEEEIFSQTLSSGLKEFQSRSEAIRKGKSEVFPGGEAFFLYDTHGLPLETIKELCSETGMVVDEADFQQRMERQREMSRQSQENLRVPIDSLTGVRDESHYLGHESMDVEDAIITALFVGNESVTEAGAGIEAILFLDRTPFYVEAGGQVGDHGIIQNDQGRARVRDTRHFGDQAIGHSLVVEQGRLRLGEQVRASVDITQRLSTERNHTATHLLHASLRRVLGEHVKQAGSLVTPSRLRFDFSHFAALTRQELDTVELLTNQKILENRLVSRAPMKREAALSTGAMALFGEKYQEMVTVVEVEGFSRELCGGTHVHMTGEIGLFTILSECSISAGIRRIEAVTGIHSLDRLRQSEQILESIAGRLRSSREDLLPALDRQLASVRELNRTVEELQAKLGRTAISSLLNRVRNIDGIPVLAARVEEVPKDGLRELADQLRRKLPEGITVLGSTMEEKANLVVMVGTGKAKKIHAGKLIKEIAPLIAGGGGGKADMAEAGGKNPQHLDQALEKSFEVIRQFLLVQRD